MKPFRRFTLEDFTMLDVYLDEGRIQSKLELASALGVLSFLLKKTELHGTCLETPSLKKLEERLNREFRSKRIGIRAVAVFPSDRLTRNTSENSSIVFTGHQWPLKEDPGYKRNYTDLLTVIGIVDDLNYGKHDEEFFEKYGDELWLLEVRTEGEFWEVMYAGVPLVCSIDFCMCGDEPGFEKELKKEIIERVQWVAEHINDFTKPFLPNHNVGTPKRIAFDVDSPGELSAGIRGFSDRIYITVESGDVEVDFVAHVREALSEWYDGASVQLVMETVDHGEIHYPKFQPTGNPGVYRKDVAGVHVDPGNGPAQTGRFVLDVEGKVVDASKAMSPTKEVCNPPSPQERLDRVTEAVNKLESRGNN